MTDDNRTDHERMTAAVAARTAAQGAASRARAAESWRTPHDDRLERLAELRRTDPEAYAAMRPTGADAIYATTHRTAVEAFRWDPGRELELSQRAAGHTFAPDAARAIDVYAAARAEAERHGVLDAARKRAEKGA